VAELMLCCAFPVHAPVRRLGLRWSLPLTACLLKHASRSLTLFFFPYNVCAQVAMLTLGSPVVPLVYMMVQ